MALGHLYRQKRFSEVAGAVLVTGGTWARSTPQKPPCPRLSGASVSFSTVATPYLPVRFTSSLPVALYRCTKSDELFGRLCTNCDELCVPKVTRITAADWILSTAPPSAPARTKNDELSGGRAVLSLNQTYRSSQTNQS